MFFELINNVALLLALCFLQTLNARLFQNKRLVEQICSGLLFGGICVIGMMKPITMAPGAIFDARSVVLSAAGLFGGPLVACLAAAIAAIFRLYLGGVGAVVGVSVIIISTLLGLGYRYGRDRGWVKIGVLQLLAFGLLVHFVADICFSFLPREIAREVTGSLTVPFILIFTPATAILGLLLQDIENRRKTERDLSLSEARYARVIEGSDQGFWELNLQTQEFKVSPRYETMMGYAAGEMALSPGDWHLHVHPEDLVKAHESIDLHCKGLIPSHELELRLRTKSGEWKWIMTRGKIVVRDEEDNPLIMSGTHTDITEKKKQEQQLRHIAHYDVLTNLPNRALLTDRLQQAIAQSTRRSDTLAVAYLDLDDFKSLNDQHGHDMGDELLIALAQRMRKVLREVDTLARIGGDEFVALLVNLERPQDYEPVLARLLQAVAEPVMVGHAVLQVSASIGVTLAPQDRGNPDQLLRHADHAMYQAKQSGKNRYCVFDVDQAAAVEAQLDNLERFRRAMQQREFVLHYQPKVNMKTGAVIGAEALIRWQHPEHGLLPPAAFLPLIEGHTISVELGEWVIDAALTQMNQWLVDGMNLPVSVNVGALQLQHADFSPRLAQLLAAHPTVPPHMLELEILETSALADINNVSEVMHICRKLGVRFALDDFGTGYSSLTYLKRLPADILKIDQTFVRDMLDDADDLAIVEGVLGLAAAFRRTSIAEGVETIAHGELLLSLGCELAQGYIIARPMPAAELPVWAAGWQPDASWIAWRDRPINRDDRMVVFVEAKHRQWLRDIESFVSGATPAPPLLEMHSGHFDHWLKAEGVVRYADHPEFHRIIELHERFHVRGQELVHGHLQGSLPDASSALPALHAIFDELVAALREFVRKNTAH